MTSERTLPSRETPGFSGTLASIFDAPDTPGLVTVSNGLHVHALPVANSTVGEIRARFRDRADIPPNSVATIDGHTASEDTVVREGQLLNFLQTSGEKGIR